MQRSSPTSPHVGTSEIPEPGHSTEEGDEPPLIRLLLWQPSGSLKQK